MKPLQLICQNCNMQYEKIKDFKAHVRSFRHKKEVTKLFDTVYFPIFVFLDYIRNPKQTQPLIGFDMVTMFITPEKIGALYLCHVCEEHLSTNDVVSHLCSVQHYFNYLANTNPELLHFAWLTDSLAYLKTTASKEYNTNGSGSLRVFELPKMMLKRCKKMPYHQGLNSLLEYSCPGFCGYLCVLCQKKIPAVQIISHCISFDHVYWYLEAAHPGTLDPPKSSYNHFSPILNKKILYVANQAQTLCPPVEIESVHLDLDSFKIINSSSYASVLENLQKKRQERNQSELNFSTTRRERIVFSPEEHESSVSTATTDSSAEQQEKKTQMDSPVVQTRDDPPCRILCVECDLTLNFIIDYKRHVKEAQHRQKLIELFGPGAISQIKLYQYMWNRKASTPVIGLPLLTVFVQRQIHVTTPFYLCHACELNIPVSSASSHVTSEQHCLNVFSYSKPDLVFLGCRNWHQIAQEEERCQGKQKMVLQDMAHPGSLRKEDSEQVSLILDLAQQAEKITPNMTLWEVDMSIGMFNKIEKSSYMSAVNVLQEVFKDKGLGELKPSVVPGARLVSTFKINKENTSSGELHGHTSSDTEKLKIDETCTITPMPKTEEKMNSESPDPLNTAHEELLKTTCISSMQVQDAEPSLATTDLNLKTSDPQIPFLNDEQSEPLKLVQKTVNQEERSDHSSTVDDLTVKLQDSSVPELQDSSVPELQDSSVPEQQSTDLGKPALQLEALQEPVQAPACLHPADHQTHSNCSEIERYLKTPDRQPESIGICGPEPGKEKVMPEWLQAQADMVEKTQGCGKAETLKLDAKDYHEIFTAPIVTALESLRLSIFKLASEIDAEKPYLKSDENHGSETFKKARETEEKDSPHAHQKKTVRFTEPDTEPGTPKQNSDDPARSSPHLWSYLTSETRTEPVIGLSMITEYRNPNGANSFLCSCCNVILSTQSYMGHLISSWHRFNYIKSKDPDFVVAGKEEIKIAELRKKAQILQDSEGWGCLKVVDKESKQPKKKTQQASGDVEKETPDNVQKQEPSEIICYTEPQDLVPKDQTSQPKPTKQQNEKKTNSAELNAVTDSEDSVNTQKLEPSQTGYDTGEENVLREPQDHNLVPKPSKSQIKKKLSKHHAVIGLNFVTCVHHDKKKLFFCELCSARGHFDHLSSETHRKAYVEHKYPGCTATGTIMKKQLNKIALSLATVERSTGIGMKKLNVTAQVFTALRTAPLSEALSHLKLLLTKPEDGVDLKARISQPEPSTFTEHTVHSMQQEKPPLLENHSCPVTGAVQETVPGVSTLFAESKGAIVGRHFMMEQSNAFRFLNVKGLLAKDPIIGLSNIWECRRISQPTFFLCLNCAEKVSREKFCNHMISERHQRLTIETQYQEEFHQWQRHSVHQMTFRDLAKTLALKEKGFDAKVFKLNKPQYESVTSADFHDAFVILKMMDMSAQPSHPAGQNQRSNEISTARSPSECVEAEKERDDQSHRSCENATQIQELHSSQVEIREFYNDRNSTAYTSLQSQSSPKALPESKAQTPQPQHQSVVIIDLTANSNSEKPTSHFPKPITKRTTKIPATETQESATAGLHERMPAHTFPHTTTIKPEKSDHEQGNSPKHTDLNYITKNKTEADALVGLSAVIECRNDGQALLDLCVSCSTIIEPKLINYHLVKSGHRYNYLKRRYPHMFEDWSDSDSRRENSKKLMKFAHKAKVANEDEPGDPQVMELNCDDLKEVKAMSYDKAIIHLQKIRKGKKLRALKTCISPKIKKKLIKQERMETDITQYSQQQPVSHGPRRALKRRAVQEDLPVQSFPGKKQCSDVPSSLLKQFPTMGKNQETSDSSIKQSMISGSDLGSDTQFQQESSILTTANPNRSLYFIPTTDPKSSKSINPNSHTYKRTTSMHKNVLKNCENQDTSSSITAPQQKDSFPNTISALSSMKGQEIARLSERASVSKSLRGNAWNYENRQFSPETASMTITNTVAENSADTGVLKQQFIASSVHNYNRNIPDKFLVSNHGGATSITSQVTPDYAMTRQYPMYKHTEYPSNTFNTAASDYLPVRERAMNYESAAPGISTNATDLMNANSAQTSHTDYQGLPVYQQIHDPETCQAYYARYSYNQALHTNQTAADDENVTSTPALEHGVYPLASWPQKKN
ncbi:hypothetical protein Q7C36_014377 [Tachysurus vachellii]|uniref:C2H2-type domain-containing protein n=1 Tax=Tachysurus vachellii TaxID=175792 RepID=A0AA88MIP0_TACVA|nr:hypothetical protein Q7C36_014377 [Tachysurus vachellii]